MNNKNIPLNKLNKEFINISDTEVENNYLYEITYIFSNLEIKSKNKVVKKKPKQKSKWKHLFCCCR